MSDSIRSLCIISSDYPTQKSPVYTFVDQLVCEFADNGINCVVISPDSISNHLVRKTEYAPRMYMRETKKGNKIKVYRPKYFSFSYSILKFNTAYLTYLSFRNCVLKEISRLNISYDAVYGHFINPSGLCAADIGEKLKIPSLAYGESSPAGYIKIKSAILKEKLNKLSGIISVSTENKRELLDTGLIKNKDNIIVLPNGIDKEKFFRFDRAIAREQLGIQGDKFIVAFLGEFSDRKGVNILSNALDQMDDVYSIFIGSGENEPKCKNILFKGEVPHERVHIYLNAADAFVLPTLAEGCCNAIIEAMACGLPVISSDMPFNDDILNDKNSIRLDVRNTEAIKQAILLLKEDKKLREKMSNEALESSSNLRIDIRAKKIIDYMNSFITNRKATNVD